MSVRLPHGLTLQLGLGLGLLPAVTARAGMDRLNLTPSQAQR